MKFKKIKQLPIFESGEVAEMNGITGDFYPVSEYTGSQAPAPLVMSDRIRVYFSARNTEKQSHIFYYDLSKISLDIMDTSTKPLIPLGNPGEADEDGTMVSQVIDEDYILYTGWNKGNDKVRYRTSCMIYQNNKKMILSDRTDKSPCGTSMPVYVNNSGDTALYMSYYKWENSEPFYSITFHDAFEFPLNLPNNKCYARPVFYDNKVFISARDPYNYRTVKDSTYRLFYFEFNRDVRYDNANIDLKEVLIEDSEDDFMQAYGYPIAVGNRILLFYNNNFQSEIQIAESI